MFTGLLGYKSIQQSYLSYLLKHRLRPNIKIVKQNLTFPLSHLKIIIDLCISKGKKSDVFEHSTCIYNASDIPRNHTDPAIEYIRHKDRYTIKGKRKGYHIANGYV